MLPTHTRCDAARGLLSLLATIANASKRERRTGSHVESKILPDSFTSVAAPMKSQACIDRIQAWLMAGDHELAPWLAG